MYTLDEIHYNTSFSPDCSQEVEHLVVLTISRLPEEVQEEIFENNVMFCDTGGAYGQYQQHFITPALFKLRDGILLFHTIYLNIDNIESEEEKMFIIAHEIAHFIFRHSAEISGTNNIQEAQQVIDTREEDADRLAKKWGFTVPERRQGK